MPYELVTLNDLTQALSTRLNNSGWWLGTELQAYIVEALRTWQVMSQNYTERVSFPTVPNQLFYNLYQTVSSLAPTVTDQDLIAEIQSQLQEPISKTSWVGTPQFGFQQVVNAIQQARDKFFMESGLGISVEVVNSAGSVNGSVELPDHVIDVRRVMWQDANNVYYTLWRVDQYDLTAASPEWFLTPGVPTDFSTVLQQPIMIQLSPPPVDQGNLLVLATNSGNPLSPATEPTVLGVPDDLAWVVKFGALANLFAQDGPGQDLSRAQYCTTRWNDGIQLARITNFVKFAYQDGVPNFVSAMSELDYTQPLWVSSLAGTPTNVGLNGNVIACNPIADNQPHSIALDVTPNFPIPSPSGFVQIGSEVVNAIVDYAQHIAYVKIGAGELKESFQLYKNFVLLAAAENDRLRANSNNFDILSDRSNAEKKYVKQRNSDLSKKELNYEVA